MYDRIASSLIKDMVADHDPDPYRREAVLRINHKDRLPDLPINLNNGHPRLDLPRMEGAQSEIFVQESRFKPKPSFHQEGF